MKFAGCLAVVLMVSCAAYAGTVAGTLTTPGNNVVPNGTLTFTLTQQALIAGTASVVTSPVNCWTDSRGRIAGLPGNAAIAAPAITQSAGGALSGTYFVRYTWAGSTGESEPSAERAVTLSGGNGTIVVQPPSNVPVNATSMKVYIGTVTGTGTLEGSVNITGGALVSGYTQSTLPSTGGNPLANTGTSTCVFRFNDEMVPSFTGYTADLVNLNGQRIPGFPQKWYLSGGTGGTVNVSSGTPLYSGVVTYPQAIVGTPPNNGMQSISGPLNLNGFGLTVGSINSSGPFLAPDGTAGAPGLAFALEPGTGMGRSSAGQEFLSILGGRKVLWDNTQRMSSTFPLTWSSAVEPFGNPPDVSLSRLQPAVVAVGSGGAGAADGFLSGQGIALNRGANTGVSLGYDNIGKFQFGSAAVAGWTSGLSSAALDTGLSRTATATVAIGNGVQGDFSGTLKVGTILGAALGGPGSTNPDTKFNRLKASQGSAISCADINTITNFGSTASCVAATGTDSAGVITIASSGSGAIANGSFILTFHDGSWTNAPTCIANRFEGFFPGSFMTTAAGPTGVTMFFMAAPSPGTSYTMNFICVGR